MAGKRELYEAGRADERSEVVAWLRALADRLPPSLVADRIERGEHAEAFVLGEEVPG